MNSKITKLVAKVVYLIASNVITLINVIFAKKIHFYLQTRINAFLNVRLIK